MKLGILRFAEVNLTMPLDLHLFESVEHAQNLATEWLWTYNNVRPHSAIGGVPPRRLTEAAYPLLLNDV